MSDSSSPVKPKLTLADIWAEIKKHRGWYFIAFLLWGLPPIIATIWPTLTDKKVPDWLTENGWPRLSLLVAGWALVTLAIAAVIVVRSYLSARQRVSQLDPAKRDYLIERMRDFVKEANKLDRGHPLYLATFRFGIGGNIEQFLSLYSPEWVARFKEKKVFALEEIIKELLDGVPIPIGLASAAEVSGSTLNIVPLPEDINLSIELDRREVFRLSQHDLALQAITAKFSNQSRPPDKITTAKQVGARILIYEADRPRQTLLEINHVCWLSHEEPFIDLERDVPQRIVLGVFEPKSEGGFEPRVTFYENHMDRNAPLNRHPYGKPYEHFHIQVILSAGDFGEFGSEHWYDLRIQYGNSWSFESLADKRKQLGEAVPPTAQTARYLSPEQLQFLAHSLVEVRGSLTIQMYREDSEAVDLGRQLHQLLRNSGWQVEWRAVLSPLSEKGIVIKTQSGERLSAANSALATALIEIGLAPTLIGNKALSPRDTILIIGSNDSGNLSLIA